jgi:hypothetical protein
MRVQTCLAALVALAATPALGQEAPAARASLDMVGTAPGACLISGAARGTGTNAVMGVAAARQADIRIIELVDPNTSLARAASISVSLPIICNVGHRVLLRTQNGGLVRSNRAGGAAAAQGFREAVPYGMTASWAGATVTGQSASGFDLIAPEAAAGDLAIDIEIPAGGAPLVAGAYSDQLVIELRVAS